MDSAPAYRFGPFELRPAEHILTRDGRRVLLSPKAFDLLRLLIERHGTVVEKRELLQTLWPNTFVEEANLSVQIAAVRKAVAAYVAHPVIETVPKRGYRFVAPVQQVIAQTTAATPPAAVRVLILPLRLLSPNPETQFLSLSLPDAIAASLAEIPWLSVRSPLDFRSSAVADLPAIMASGSADVVLDGALGELGGETRLRLSLLRMPSGIVLHAEQAVIKLSELFELQSRVSRQIARVLTAHLGRAEALDTRTRVPSTPGAYVLYLRANQLAYETSQWASARDLYEAALRDDPNYAPAWARLARCHRVIGKFLAPPTDSPGLFARAEEAFQRALSLDPDLSLAHSLYAQLEVDTGRSEQAMLRLIARARRQPHAPDLFSGLVHALRFCGLLDLSIAAHRRARTLDPTVPTSVHHTWWMKGEYEKALSETFGDIGYMPGLALASLGRNREAIAALRWRERETADSRGRCYIASLRALLEGHRDESLRALDNAVLAQVDAEANYYVARTYARLGETGRAMREMERVIEGGFLCYETFARDPWLNVLRSDARLAALVDAAQSRSARAESAFVCGGGGALLVA